MRHLRRLAATATVALALPLGPAGAARASVPVHQDAGSEPPQFRAAAPHAPSSGGTGPLIGRVAE